jgi:2-polyprenyl-3-methyl-5-hydroxy-6-metoxy-1,4-benzoquinol methylase
MSEISDWPEAGLESVPRCPVCSDDHRSLMHRDLVDPLFDAPGRWNMMSCHACGTAFLDPRPNRDTIHLAYERYYTHNEESAAVQVHGHRWLQSLKKNALDAFYRHRFRDEPWRAADLLAPLVRLKPSFARILEGEMRHLPKLSGKKRLLDIGCGSGRFLARACDQGWTCVGTEVDPVSVARARERGFTVHQGSVESFAELGEQFDAVTLSHVIEHVHDPLSMLISARRLLRPGGLLWIETPNVSAPGHSLEGSNWVGLHPPFHLMVFSVKGLQSLLEKAGFTEIAHAPWRPTVVPFARLSAILSKKPTVSRRPRYLELLDESRGLFNVSRREFITFTARADSSIAGT